MTDPPWPVWLPWLTVLSAAALGALYAFRTFLQSLDARIFAKVVAKLLAAGNSERALKLCLAAGTTPLASATRAAILACTRGVAHSDPSGGYRSAGDLSPERVLAPVRAAYDAAFETLAAPIRAARYAAIAGALMFFAALALVGARSPVDPPPLLAAAFGLVVIAWSGVKERGILASRDATFAALAGGLDALIRNPLRAPNADAPTHARVRFEVSEPGLAPRVVDSADDVIKIGSLHTAQVCLDAPRVARLHAVVEVTEAACWVIDLGNEATTRLNGEAVTRRELSDGDVLSIGDAELRVRLSR